MKKAIASLLAAGMAASLLAGCGGSTSSAAASTADTSTASSTEATSTADSDTPLEGEITFWHSFTQGARMEAVQKAADKFMEENPGVKINIETYSWGDFNTKWNAGLTTGDLPDMSTAQGTGEVVEMLNADVLTPLDDMVDEIGRDRFSENALADMTSDGSVYGVPYYSHAQVMWYRTDLLEAAGLDVPKTWDEFYDAAVALTKDGQYGAAFSCSPNDLLSTRYLNYYVTSAGGSLLNDDLTANLTSKEAIDGINFWLKVYKNCSPAETINYTVNDHATLFYQGKTAFDFNSGFMISGVQNNTPEIAQRICNSTKLPVIIDGENGGGTPMQVYRNVKRLAEVGAMAISIEDTNNGAFATGYTYASGYGYMDAERWAANVQAAVEATKGTDCMIIARTDCKGGGAPQTGAIAKFGGMGLEEAIRRAEMGYQAGAEITMIQNICHADCEDECREISRRLSKPGRYLFYPDVHATDGKPDATLEQMQEWGFHLVSNHVAMKGAARGMLEFFRENFKNKNTVYSENHEIDPSGEFDIGHEFHLFKFEDYIALDKKYRAYEEELRAKNSK